MKAIYEVYKFTTYSCNKKLIFSPLNRKKKFFCILLLHVYSLEIGNKGTKDERLLSKPQIVRFVRKL